jgi:phage terminase large subunit-like protein
VVNVIKTVDRSVKVDAVRANKGKLLRAEPVAGLYEQGKVYHAKPFKKLEQQMVEWTATDRKSPDRIDALVYGITDLMLTPVQRVTRWLPDDLIV